MKILKKILIIVAIIIAVPFIIALFVPKDYAVEREIIINKPKTNVFNYIKYLKNQDNYSKWNKLDPAMKKNYTGTDGTVGFVSAWDSKHENVGVGEQEITKIVEGEKIEMKLRFKVPFEAEDDAYMITTSNDIIQTKVKWGFKGAFPYPMNLMKLFINMEKEIGNDLEVGLKNLKVELEK